MHPLLGLSQRLSGLRTHRRSHSYGNPYPGPIGAVLVPQLRRGQRTALEDSLPYASSLCGACYVACPVKIDIPKILVRLRSEVVDEKRREHPRDPELVSMRLVEKGFSSARFFQRVIALGGLVGRLPLHDVALPSATAEQVECRSRRPVASRDVVSFVVRSDPPG